MGRSYEIMRDAALRAKGEEWRNAILFWMGVRVAAPWVALAAVVGAAGWLAHWAWVRVTAPSPANDAAVPVVASHTLSAVPVWAWFTGAALIALVAWMFRPGRLITPAQQRARIVQVFAVVLLFAGVVGYGLSVATAGG